MQRQVLSHLGMLIFVPFVYFIVASFFFYYNRIDLSGSFGKLGESFPKRHGSALQGEQLFH